MKKFLPITILLLLISTGCNEEKCDCKKMAIELKNSGFRLMRPELSDEVNTDALDSLFEAHKDEINRCQKIASDESVKTPREVIEYFCNSEITCN
jgi:hypothetical protein